MQPPVPISLLAKLDTGLNHAAGYLLRSLKPLALWLTGLIVLFTYIHMVFEYGEGLADISQFEWAFMLLAALLTWRHCHYARQFGYGFWRGLARGLAAQGMALIVELTLLGLLILLTLWAISLPIEWRATANAIDDGDIAFKTYEIIGQAMVLLALYLGAPTRPLDTAATLSRQQAVRQDPTLASTPDKEVSL